jgi:hypothetical protein
MRFGLFPHLPPALWLKTNSRVAVHIKGAPEALVVTTTPVLLVGSTKAGVMLGLQVGADLTAT